MATIIPFLQNDAFDPDALGAMPTPLEEVCLKLHVNGDQRAREAMAVRIIDLARQGEREQRNHENRIGFSQISRLRRNLSTSSVFFSAMNYDRARLAFAISWWRRFDSKAYFSFRKNWWRYYSLRPSPKRNSNQ